MVDSVRLEPPPNRHVISGRQQPSATWKNWFSNLHEILKRQGLISAPPGFPGTGDGVYWNKITDPAFAHMLFQNPTTPKTVTNGVPITDWDLNPIPDWIVSSDLTAGTMTIESGAEFPETGYYAMSLSGFMEGTQNTNYVFTLYQNGVATPIKMPVLLKGNMTGSPIAWAGVVRIDTASVLDIRLETGATADIYTINWSMHRISPVQEN